MTPNGAMSSGGGDPLVVDCPLRKHVIEVIVLADDDAGLPDECVAVRSGSMVMRTKTDSEGWCRFEGLEAGTIDVSLYKLDGEAWERIAAAPLPPERLSSSQKPAWKPDPNDPPAVTPARTLRAGRGESISTIAVANGFTPGQVWQLGGNQTATIEKQVRGEVLSHGQTVDLPPRQRRWDNVPVDQRYYLHRIAVPFSLTIRFLDGVGKPRRELRYLLRVTTKTGSADRSLYGATDLDGYLVESISPDAVSGELLVQGEDGNETYPLQLAALEPVTLLEGVQQRLNNLGYWCGDPHGTLGDGTRRALRKFQRRCGLTESGEADDRTRTLLLAVHCS